MPGIDWVLYKYCFNTKAKKRKNKLLEHPTVLKEEHHQVWGKKTLKIVAEVPKAKSY
jgi:hypothetical protein